MSFSDGPALFTHRRETCSSVLAFLVTALTCFALWALTSQTELGFLGGDTDQYLAMAESIRKGELLLPLDPLTAHPPIPDFTSDRLEIPLFLRWHRP